VASIKAKSFCVPKDTIRKVKRQSTEWEEIFENHISMIYIKNPYNDIIKRANQGVWAR
jgi:hypothetical protein